MDGTKQIGHRGALIVVSNRLPYTIPKAGPTRPPKRNIGGLVNALEPVLASTQGCWIGWDGHALGSSAEVDRVLADPPRFTTETGIQLHGVPITDREVARYYHGLSNRALWPLFHNLLDKSVFQPDDWSVYERVNQRFARAVLAHAGRQDRVWVHDYHLMLVPRYLRELGFRGRIDCFLHIPFPAPELFRCLPWRGELVNALLCADTIGFHVESYRDNFVRTVESLRRDEVSVRVAGNEVRLRHHDGTTIAGVSPIGVEVEDFERLAGLDSVREKTRRLRHAHGGRRLIFGADRLDYTKGIRERLLAVERLLKRQPRRADQFVMLQVVVPSRSQVEEYRAMKREIDREAGRINADFGRAGWTPIHYEYRALDREDLVAHYRAADVALVTPLRDGMNLVAPEFVASRTDDDGVLVLSEFAGVSEQLHDAVSINPYDLNGFADAIASALDMIPPERASRMKGLRFRIRENTLSDWAFRCLNFGGAELNLAYGGQAPGLRHSAEPRRGRA